jgi:hypothetical protein
MLMHQMHISYDTDVDAPDAHFDNSYVSSVMLRPKNFNWNSEKVLTVKTLQKPKQNAVTLER